jgi:hypothetical protein
VNCCNPLYKGPINSIIKSKPHFISHANPGYVTLFIIISAHMKMRMRTATGQKIIRAWAYNRRILEPGISQPVTYKGDVHNEMPRFIRTTHESRQVAPLSAFPRTRCNWRGASVALLFCIYFIEHYYFRNRDNIVGIATGCGLDDRGVRVRVPVGSKVFSSPRRLDRLWGSPNLLSNGYRGSFPGG